MKMKLFATAATGFLLAAASTSAMAADLLGAGVTATLLYPDMATTYAGPVSAVVGPSVEFPAGAFSPAAGSFDIAANTVTYFTNQVASYGTGAFNGYRLDFSGKPITLTGLTLNQASTFQPSQYFLQGNSLFINVSGQQANGGYALFDINVAGVPEPSTWALMLVGFGAVGFAMRRRRRAPRERVSVSYS